MNFRIIGQIFASLMIEEKYHYWPDLTASFLTPVILILSFFIGSGKNDLLRYAAVSSLAIAVVLWIYALFSLKKCGQIKKGGRYYDTNALIENGVFSLIRHPQYLAYILLVAGFVLLTQSWIIIFLAGVAIILFYVHTGTEERELKQKFGIVYDSYCARVPRFNLILGFIRKIAKE